MIFDFLYFFVFVFDSVSQLMYFYDGSHRSLNPLQVEKLEKSAVYEIISPYVMNALSTAYLLCGDGV